MIEKSIAVLGGDKRQLFCAKAFAREGFRVYISGFDRLVNYGDLISTDIYTALNNSSVAVFPVTGIKGNTVPVYFSDIELKLGKKEINALKDKIVFCGKSDTIKSLCKDICVYDYLACEQFAVANALPTAEGAVQVAMEKYEGLISGSNSLVIGYGRIGKILSRLLKAMDSNVCVSARRAEHFEYIIADGNKPLNTKEINTLNNYDLVFNTVPSLLIDKKVLENTDTDPLIIDLASIPGGVDFDTAKSMNITAVHALSLPGKCSPKSAGEITAHTILNILKEEYGWQKQI